MQWKQKSIFPIIAVLVKCRLILYQRISLSLKGGGYEKEGRRATESR